MLPTCSTQLLPVVSNVIIRARHILNFEHLSVSSCWLMPADGCNTCTEEVRYNPAAMTTGWWLGVTIRMCTVSPGTVTLPHALCCWLMVVPDCPHWNPERKTRENNLFKCNLTFITLWLLLPLPCGTVLLGDCGTELVYSRDVSTVHYSGFVIT